MLASGPMLPDLPPPSVHIEPLPYEARLDPRPRAQVDLVVIHCTELPDLATAREQHRDRGELVHTSSYRQIATRG